MMSHPHPRIPLSLHMSELARDRFGGTKALSSQLVALKRAACFEVTGRCSDGERWPLSVWVKSLKSTGTLLDATSQQRCHC